MDGIITRFKAIMICLFCPNYIALGQTGKITLSAHGRTNNSFKHVCAATLLKLSANDKDFFKTLEREMQ